MEHFKAKRLKIPHVTKRLNKIEKYVKLYSEQAVNFSQEKRENFEMSYISIYDSSKNIFEEEIPKKHSKSVFVS